MLLQLLQECHSFRGRLEIWSTNLCPRETNFCWHLHGQGFTYRPWQKQVEFICLMSYFYHENIVARSNECRLHHGFYMPPENSFLKWLV